MTDALEVYLWGSRIGILWQPEEDICASFEYDRDFLQSGIEPAPFCMPLSDRIYRFPELGRSESFFGLPGLLAGSLPDSFGKKVINCWLQSCGRDPRSLTPIERLMLSGNRGMGALEFVPGEDIPSQHTKIDVTEMADIASKILSVKGKDPGTGTANPLDAMMRIGSLAGGARAKAVVWWNEETGEMISGDQMLPDAEGFNSKSARSGVSGRGIKTPCSGKNESKEKKDSGSYSPWLIKFDGVTGNGDRGVADPKQHTRIEYAYYLMAKDAGIRMQECRLFEKDGRSHFMTLRYDRMKGRKIHTQTLSDMIHSDYDMPRTCSYELLAKYAAKLHPSLQETREMFRRAVFNFAAVNCDDHVKNFSFLMDRSGAWSISPAYDLTFAFVLGHRWLGSHQMTLNGKSYGIKENDLMAFGRRIGLTESYCRDAIREILEVIKRWPNYAERCGIAEERAKEIDDVIRLAGIILK